MCYSMHPTIVMLMYVFVKIMLMYMYVFVKLFCPDNFVSGPTGQSAKKH